MEGNVKDAEFVDACVAGQDIVFSTLGYRLPSLAPWNRPEDPTLVEVASANIIAAMKNNGVKKACILTGAGAGDSYSKVSMVMKVALSVSALAHVYPHLTAMENLYLAEPKLDVCIPRPALLTDGPATTNGKVVDDIFGNRSISRADVAHWMVDEALKPGLFEHKTALLADS